MDIKLKDKKNSLSSIVFLLSLCIALIIGSCITIRTMEIDRNRSLEVKQEHFESIYRCVYDLMQYADGLSGELRKDSIDYEVNRLKGEGGIYDGQGRYMVSDEELEKYVIDNFNKYVHDVMVNLNLRKNIEFYFEMDEGRNPFTNVDNISKDEFEEDTLNNYSEYIIIKPNGKLETSKGMKKIGEYLINYSEGRYILTHNEYDVAFRIAQPLQEGDLIYENIMRDRRSSSAIYTCVVILILSCICILYCIIKLKKNNYNVNVEKGIINLLSKIDIEAKLVALSSAYVYIVRIKRSNAEYSMLENLIPIFIILFLIFFVAMEFFRIKFVYGGLKLKSIISRESLIKKLKEIFIRGGMVLNLLFILANISVWYISLALFINIGCDFGFGIYFLNSQVFATFSTMIFDGIIIRKLNSIKDIVKGIKEISHGNYNFNVDIKGPKIFKEVARDLDNIQNGLKESVDKAVRSEKMKGELITNVSHDLKTPLTSIINYVDLLNQENITEEQRKKYLGILKDKSNRLKALIEDLFEVSKASSGSMKLDMQDLDPVALLRQTLGEFQDKIENSNLKIIKKIPEEKLVVYADGRKTFRVFQNLLSNIFKYSMEGSRVYEEILQRFKRGDASRTTEGSGLGLAIAKSLTEVQEGIFDIKIDGDLFKAIVKLKKEK